jgi:hypothetical protein
MNDINEIYFRIIELEKMNRNEELEREYQELNKKLDEMIL